jgi:nitrate reductase delta subunit
MDGANKRAAAKPAEVVARCFLYPRPDSLEKLWAAVEQLPKSSAERHIRRFIQEVSALELGRWEELHTVTLDLSPHFGPYVGHVAWGENYRRGAFMADLKAAMAAASVDLGGELPDHIEPILRYIATVEEPRADLVEVLPSAVRTMKVTLDKAAPKNPYRHVLAAADDVAADLRPLKIGSRR